MWFKNKKLYFAFLFLMFNRVWGQDISIISQPAEIHKSGNGIFEMSEKTVVVCDDQLKKSSGFFSKYCNEIYRINLQEKPKDNGSNTIHLQLEKDFLPGQYNLEIEKRGIKIAGDGSLGCFR